MFCKVPLYETINKHSYQFCLTFYILCLGCLPKMKGKKISATALQQQTRFFVYHRQTQERLNMLWNAGQFSLLFWKIYSWLSKQIALTGSGRFTTTESPYYILCYTALLYRKIFIPLNLYIRQILSYLKQNESYLFETIFGFYWGKSWPLPNINFRFSLATAEPLRLGKAPQNNMKILHQLQSLQTLSCNSHETTSKRNMDKPLAKYFIVVVSHAR